MVKMVWNDSRDGNWFVVATRIPAARRWLGQRTLNFFLFQSRLCFIDHIFLKIFEEIFSCVRNVCFGTFNERISNFFERISHVPFDEDAR